MSITAARILAHIINSEVPLSVRDIEGFLDIKYHTVYKALAILEQNNFVTKVGKNDKQYLYTFDLEGEKAEAAKKWVEQNAGNLEVFEGLNSLIGKSLEFGPKDKRPLEDWLRSFALRPQALSNSIHAPEIMAIMVAEIYTIALDQKDQKWVKDAKLDELKHRLTTEVERPLHNLLLFIRQLKHCAYLWDGRTAERYLIERPKVDQELILEYCKKIVENFQEKK